MIVHVDTTIWSLLLRRTPKNLSPEQQALRNELAELIREGRAQLIGPIRQEVLSGIRDATQFRRLRDHLRAFDDGPVKTRDYEEAARASNRCRAEGVAGSSIDFLICAVAMHRKWPIFTTDRDFAHYAQHLPIQVHTPRAGLP
ncbi:MAG: PIN domain-containing protein [Acidobacteria bacterium]|nr:PIN domain-containing protein [Acidobacteriota bacterium]